MPRPILFLDDGGVMNDNARRGPQWQRLVGSFFVPLLGGTPTAWAEANHVVAERLFAPEAWQERLHAAGDYASFERDYQAEWLTAMCALVGVPAPPLDDAVTLARRAYAWITARVDAAFPGAVAAITTLHAGGYTLHTASGEPSTDLAGYLTGMGVRDCFGRLYGPDLLGALKADPEYYARLFADLGLSPADALVVDDSATALGWAREAGARTVLVGQTAAASVPGTARIGSLAELPALLSRRAE